MQLLNRESKIANGEWLPDMDLNHDKQIQSLLCYRYTIGQTGVSGKLRNFIRESRIVKALHRYIVASEMGGWMPAKRFDDSTIQCN